MVKQRVDFKKMYYGFPILLISYYDSNGVPNITTLSSSFTLSNMVCLGFGSQSYAVNEIKKVKDFVINIPNRKLMKEIDICGYTSGKNCNKFQLSKLTPVKSDIINAPTIEECSISIECTLNDVIEKDCFKGITNILAEIKGRTISKELLDDETHLIYSKLDPVLYIGDDSQKMYRYVKNDLGDFSKSFL